VASPPVASSSAVFAARQTEQRTHVRNTSSIVFRRLPRVPQGRRHDEHGQAHACELQ
jgi:hypothetical protein